MYQFKRVFIAHVLIEMIEPSELFLVEVNVWVIQSWVFFSKYYKYVGWDFLGAAPVAQVDRLVLKVLDKRQRVEHGL